MIRILVADDELEAADALKRNIDGRDGIQIVGLASNGREAIQQCGLHHPDIILMDIHMPVMDGIEASRQIKTQYPNVKIVILTMFREKENVFGALKAHCVGYVYKGHKSDELIAILQNIRMGFSVYENGVSEVLRENVGNTVVDRSLLQKLSDREIEIIRLVTAGKKDIEIAGILFLDSGYVRNCLLGIREKLGVRTTKDLAVLGARMGL